MPVWIRRTFIALAAPMLGLAAGAVWLVDHFDPERFKSVAIEWMKSNRNRTLEINGPISLSVFPRLQVRLASVSLSEVGRPYSSITLDEAALGVALLPLLRGTLAVDRIDASGLRLHWLRDSQGNGNFDDLWPRAGAPAAAGDALRFDVRSFSLADVQLRIRDEVGGIDGVLDMKELNAGRIADGVDSKVELVAQFGLKTPALKGELSGSTRFTPDFGQRRLRLSGMNLAYRGDAPGASSIEATLRGALAWNSGNGALDGQSLALRMTGNAAGIKFNGSSLTMDRFALDVSNKAFSIGKLKLRLLGARAGKPLDLMLDWPDLDVTGKVLKGSALSGQLSLGGALPLKARFQSGAPVGSFDEVRVPAFVVRASGSAAAHTLDATLRSEMVLQSDKRAMLLEESDLQLRFDAPGLKPLTLALKGSGTASAGSARWTVAGQLNGNRFDSHGAASFSGITPHLKVQAHFEGLDIDSLLAAPPMAASTTAGTETPIDLEALRLVNGNFAIRIGSLLSRNYRIGDARLDASLEAGMLRVPTMRGNIWGGSVAGSAFADARASRLALRAVASSVDINALLRDVMSQDVLQGRGNFAVDIESAGRSVNELRSRLKGRAEIALRDGTIAGINLERNLSQARTALTAGQDTLVRASKAEKTAFSDLRVGFRINDGVAHTADLQLRSPLLRLGGEGELDLARGRVDYTVRTTLTDGGKGATDGTDLSALKGITVPIGLSGAFDAIVWNIEWSKAAVGAVKPPAAGKPKDRRAPKGAATGVPGWSAAERANNKVKGLVK
jgi:AsmA protein